MREYEMSMEEEIKKLVKKVDAMDQKVDTLDKSVTSKLDQIMVRLDDTHEVAKLGLEGIQGLRESTDAKFEAAAKSNADQMGLLKSVLVHVRQRVDASDRHGTRRRKS